MIEVSKLNGQRLWINSEKILCVEQPGDTVVVFDNGDRLLIQDSPSEIQKKIIIFKKNLLTNEGWQDG